MPIYKSMADAFIYIYIHNHFNLEAPFIFGNREDTPPIKLFERWLKSAGYIYSRRSYNQSVQSRYINSAMLKEIIENNKLTMVFQNSERLRTGKFYRRTTPDLSVQWIIDAYRNMPVQAENLVIVPVMTSYDRIFETHNLTSEMVKGKGEELTFMEYMKRIYSFRKDQLGEVFVKYLEPIYVRHYLE
jgi:glycerol-3-phosphate O-acyltransferase